MNVREMSDAGASDRAIARATVPPSVARSMANDSAPRESTGSLVNPAMLDLHQGRGAACESETLTRSSGSTVPVRPPGVANTERAAGAEALVPDGWRLELCEGFAPDSAPFVVVRVVCNCGRTVLERPTNTPLEKGLSEERLAELRRDALMLLGKTYEAIACACGYVIAPHRGKAA